jgi:hypothetical protein
MTSEEFWSIAQQHLNYASRPFKNDVKQMNLGAVFTISAQRHLIKRYNLWESKRVVFFFRGTEMSDVKVRSSEGQREREHVLWNLR